MAMKIVMTGGHHTSALPIIKKLREQNSEVNIFWFGHRQSLSTSTAETLEYKDITALNIPFFDLKAGKLYKTYNLKRLTKVPFGVFHALYLLLKTKPDVVLSFGGYLGAPTVLAAWMLRIPAFTHEQTLVAGYSNRFSARFCKKVFISWPESAKYFPENKISLVGLPLRDEIFKISSDAFSVNPDLPTVYITAGKTGSHKINMLVKEALPRLLSMCNVIHQCGDHPETNDYENLEALKKTPQVINKPGKYFVKKFVLANEIGEAFGKSDLVVGRAGAHTVAEVIALEKPAILIPISWVSHNEQYENAKFVVSTGLGTLLEEKDLNPDIFVSTIADTLQSLSSKQLEKKEIKSDLMKDSSSLIISEIIAHVSKKSL